MYDRPNLGELLDAVRGHLETQVIEAVRPNRKLYFQTLIAINLLKIAERELTHYHAHQNALWERLNKIQGQTTPLPTEQDTLTRAIIMRNQQLCTDIHNGHFDEPTRQKQLFEHLVASTVEQLVVANPKFLQTLVETNE